MPTENRSSNTEIQTHHPQGRRERFQKWVIATKQPVLGYLDGAWLARGDDREGYADKYVQGLWVAFKEFAQPSPQPHPEPIAWMVGTAFWWTKEEAERDAAATGLPVIGLGPMSGTAPIEQRQVEPLPITNDMHRMMEACRIGEFKDEGGSETVEALAVASLDAKSSMGHDADSYMAGYSAALYEQAEPFIWLSLNSQRQGAPAAWRGLNELGEVVTEWIDGAPPSNMVDLSGNPASFARIEQAYTHTDPGEVERLRAALKFYADREHYHFESGNWDTVSGEPLNILWCGDEPDFIEDGSVARAALERQP